MLPAILHHVGRRRYLIMSCEWSDCSPEDRKETGVVYSEERTGWSLVKPGRHSPMTIQLQSSIVKGRMLHFVDALSQSACASVCLRDFDPNRATGLCHIIFGAHSSCILFDDPGRPLAILNIITDSPAWSSSSVFPPPLHNIDKDTYTWLGSFVLSGSSTEMTIRS